PMKLVLDAPVTARNLQHAFGGHVLGKQIITHRRLVGTSATKAPARGDASKRSNTGKAICGCHTSVAEDGGAPRFLPVVPGGFSASGRAALAGSGKAPHHPLEQFALILLERENVVGAALEYRGGERATAME